MKHPTPVAMPRMESLCHIPHISVTRSCWVCLNIAFMSYEHLGDGAPQPETVDMERFETEALDIVPDAPPGSGPAEPTGGTVFMHSSIDQSLGPKIPRTCGFRGVFAR